jgi:hypothetical protein
MNIEKLERRLSKLNPKSFQARQLKRKLDKLGVSTTPAPEPEPSNPAPEPEPSKPKKKKRTYKKK